VEKFKPMTKRESLRGRKANYVREVKLGGEGDAVGETTFSSQSSKSFFFNYNTVESVLLFSAVLTNLSGIMFESGQLANGSSNDGLAYLVIVMISLSVTYFAVVLGAELLFAFMPHLKIFQKKEEEDLDDGTEFTSDNPLVKQASTFDSDAALDAMAEKDDSKNAEALQEMQDIIQQQKNEIKELQQQAANANLTKSMGSYGNSNKGKKEKKKKKNFMSSQPPEAANIEMTDVPGKSHDII